MFRVLIFTRVTISDVYALVEQILLALQRSTIAPREAQDKMSHFWNVYKVESEEYDEELYAIYSGRMDNSTIFVCLSTFFCIFVVITFFRVPFFCLSSHPLHP